MPRCQHRRDSRDIMRVAVKESTIARASSLLNYWPHRVWTAFWYEWLHHIVHVLHIKRVLLFHQRKSTRSVPSESMYASSMNTVKLDKFDGDPTTVLQDQGTATRYNIHGILYYLCLPLWVWLKHCVVLWLSTGWPQARSSSDMNASELV